jgi:hypothetical protein
MTLGFKVVASIIDRLFRRVIDDSVKKYRAAMFMSISTSAESIFASFTNCFSHQATHALMTPGKILTQLVLLVRLASYNTL